MDSYSVYKHTAPNGKSYIGITSKSPDTRWANGKGYIGQTKFWNAIKKYGWENITHEILFKGISKEEACEKEKELIEKYDTIRKGYNSSSGGEFGNSGNYKYITGEEYGGFTIVGRTEKKIKLQCNDCGAIITRYAECIRKNCVKCKCKIKYNPNPKPMNYCIIEYKGKKQSLKQWAEELGIPAGTIRQRFKNGYPIDQPRQGIVRRETCPVCGTSFDKHSKDQKYCCQACQWEAMKTERKTFTCLNCGKDFKAHRSINKDYKAKFCSVKCRIDWQRSLKDVGMDGKQGQKETA